MLLNCSGRFVRALERVGMRGEVGELGVRYEVRGEGAAVVFLHGWGGGLRGGAADFERACAGGGGGGGGGRPGAGRGFSGRAGGGGGSMWACRDRRGRRRRRGSRIRT